MLHKEIKSNHSTAAVMEPDLVVDMKKTEMKHAILERFVYRPKTVAPQTRIQPRPRSPFWQAVDEEC